jgi:hypothetical protein
MSTVILHLTLSHKTGIFFETFIIYAFNFKLSALQKAMNLFHYIEFCFHIIILSEGEVDNKRFDGFDIVVINN